MTLLSSTGHRALQALLLCAALAAAFATTAQTSPNPAPNTPSTPRALSYADTDAWRTIATPALSNDGAWLAYSVQPQLGDGELVLRERSSGKERREAVGMLPPPVTTPNTENPDAPPPPRAIRVVFSSDSRFLVASTHPPQAETLAARKARTRPDDMPKGGLLILDLQGSAPALRVPRVKSLALPSKGGAWLAYLKEAEPAAAARPAAAGSAPAAPAAARAPAAGAATAPGAPRKEYGTELVVRDLARGTERRIADVLEMSWARDGQTLVYTVSGRNEANNGVYVLAPQSGAAPVALLSGKGRYSKLTWDRAQTQLAFLSDRDDEAAKVPAFKLYHWPRGSAAAVEKVTAATPGFPAGQVISDKGAIAFSRDGKQLYVPAAPPPKPPRTPESQPHEEDRVVADLWRWNDDLVQPMQRVRAVVERNRSYRGVLDLASNRYVQLADESLRSVSLSDDGQRALGLDDRAYRRRVDYDGLYHDVYVVNPRSGERKLALKMQRLGFNAALNPEQWSPDGRWLLHYQDRQWSALDTETGVLKPLSKAIARPVHNELHDSPGPAAAYGTAGWTSDSRSALVYDRYDVWQVFVDGRAPRNLTLGEGRKTRTRLVVQRVDPVDEDDDERGIDTSKPLTLRGESETTRASGFLRTSFDAKTVPQKLTWGDQAWRFVARAREADVALTTASRFDAFPELRLSDSSLANPQAVTEVGAQMQAFRWGRGELMSFRNAKGVALQAAVYKPADFDPKKKYPVMVYIYERVAQNVHNFVNPTPSNIVNISLYTSNGYVVLAPDIAYTVGQPGRSALDAVLPAIDALVKKGGIDEKNIGIQGHSWGGYQIAWMVTKTNRFKAAGAGAPVGNMTSAYSGIRWGSGLPRQFQYEQGQSRIGPSMNKALPLYLENSPVFHVDKVKTPLLILHNDADDAVPWVQGIELFLALRRLEKEAYLFNYNNQLHNLRRRADQKDFAVRMQQFFDHFLKGAPVPAWMRDGIPFNDREEEKESFAKAAATPP
jgi:dipeptidyl aminopeptidase/acylaminoacyl peptidase